jgi:hypothetical protein
VAQVSAAEIDARPKSAQVRALIPSQFPTFSVNSAHINDFPEENDQRAYKRLSVHSSLLSEKEMAEE